MTTTIPQITKDCRTAMEKSFEASKRELASIRTGRASISILDNIQVDYYGVPTPINQVAQLATPEATLITVQPYDVSLVGPIEKSISVLGGSAPARSPGRSGRPIGRPTS